MVVRKYVTHCDFSDSDKIQQSSIFPSQILFSTFNEKTIYLAKIGLFKT